MKYITVLDFEDGKVYQYEISAWGNGDWNPDSESIEQYLTSKGHNLSNIEWMVHSDNKIITN
jgi:hypothetical protein